MKMFLFVFAFVVASSAAHACDPGHTAFQYKGASVLLDSTGKMIVQPTSLLGSKFLERNGAYFAITPRGAELPLEAYCVD